MKARILAFCLIFCCLGVFAELKYFDVLFGINSIETTETLEGIQTETVFTLHGTGNLINIVKMERANGRREYHLACSEMNNSFQSVVVRISIDGTIHEFIEDSPRFSASRNRASWNLSNEIINQLLGCNEIAIEFGGKVHRYNENDFAIDSYGRISTFADPIGRIKQFLE